MVPIDILTVFIKDIIFHYVGISWLMETKDQYDFAADKKCF